MEGSCAKSNEDEAMSTLLNMKITIMLGLGRKRIFDDVDEGRRQEFRDVL